MHPIKPKTILLLVLFHLKLIEAWGLSSQHQPPLPTTTMTRRTAAGLSSLLVLTTPPAHADTDTTPSSACSSSALTQERAVPGAYENACMSLPVRDVTIATNPTTTTLHIQQSTSGAGTTGLAVWNSSLLLSRLLPFLSFNNNKNNNPLVVELGCGTGLASLTAAATLSSARVIATDGNPDVAALAQRNIQANGFAAPQMTTRVMPWGLLQVDDDLVEAADWVLGSDLTYNAGSWPVLAETMSTLIKPQGGIVVYLSLGHAGFNVQAEVDGFLSVAKGQGLVQIQPTDPEWPLANQVLPETLLRQTCRSGEERSILESGGGVRVVFLRKAGRRRKNG